VVARATIDPSTRIAELVSLLPEEPLMTKKLQPESGATRREFIQTTAAAGVAALAAAALPGGAFAAGGDQIKVGLIGCGGRGTGAITDRGVLTAAPNVTIWALADAFEDRLNGCRNRLNEFVEKEGKEDVKRLGNKVDVPKERCFVGLDAYQKLLETDVNYIILATPPGFRPIHLKAAVEAGKHIFTEKPVCVDAPGYRSVVDTAKKAEEKKLAIVAGTQRRHQLGYIETMKRLINDKAIGDIVAGRCYWNQGILWFQSRKPDMTDLQYQMRNWYNFPWLCGDHIVEQHVHNLDVINWALGAVPLKAAGMGGRQRSVPNPDDYGVIFDHFAVDYEYPNGVHVLSECRQIDGCWESISEAVQGTKGFCQVNAYTIDKKPVITKQQDEASQNPYIQEHTDLIESIRSGKPLNELKQVADSTMTAILGRMSTYTGKPLTWEQAVNSKKKLMPDELDWDMDLPAWKVPVPGKTKFV
jgi:predicted dehydrogenase